MPNLSRSYRIHRPDIYDPDDHKAYYLLNREMLVKLIARNPNLPWITDIFHDVKQMEETGPGVQMLWGLSSSGGTYMALDTPENRDHFGNPRRLNLIEVYTFSWDKKWAGVHFASRNPLRRVWNTEAELRRKVDRVALN